MEPSSSSNNDSSDEATTRSRSSSIVSTGTKTSIGTMGTFLTTGTGLHGFTPLSPTPPAEQTTSGSSIDVLLGRRNFRISARPGSILSISSFDVPAPPYHEAIRSAAIPVEIRDGAGTKAADNATFGDRENAEDDEDNDDDNDNNNDDENNRPSTGDMAAISRLNPRSSANAASHLDLPHEGDEAHDSELASLAVGAPSSSLDVEATRNAISRHYTDIVRQIDSNHQNIVASLKASHEAQLSAQRTELEVSHEAALDDLRDELSRAHDADLAAQRNTIDAKYRQEFGRMRAAMARTETDKARAEEDREAADARIRELVGQAEEVASELAAARREIASMGADVERLALEADERERVARNQVEDVWEGRWKQRMDLAAEQMGKADREFKILLGVIAETYSAEDVERIKLVAKERNDAVEEARKKPPSTPKKKIWGSFSSQS